MQERPDDDALPGPENGEGASADAARQAAEAGGSEPVAADPLPESPTEDGTGTARPASAAGAQPSAMPSRPEAGQDAALPLAEVPAQAPGGGGQASPAQDVEDDASPGTSPRGMPPAASAADGTEPAGPGPVLFAHALRLAEALVFASDRPVTPQRLQQALPAGVEAQAVLTALAAQCADRPVQLVEVAGGFAFRTAPELAPALTRVVEVPRRLPRAAMETLAIIAYHQPVTRAEVEEIRGASLSQSTLESLLEMGLIAPRGRKEVPGRPSLWGTTPKFLEQFGLRGLSDLPRREELVNEPGSALLSAPPASGSAPAA